MLVNFEYTPDISQGEIYQVRAGVHLGTTSARGDNPDDVLWLEVIGDDGDRIRIPDEVYQDLCELSIVEARGYKIYDRQG